MSELKENVLDDQLSDYTDLESLLAVANSSEFSVSDGFTTEKQEFEKFNSFFEIVTSNETKYSDNEGEVLGKKGEPNMQGIDHSKLVPLLVKTIQELEARLTAGGL